MTTTTKLSRALIIIIMINCLAPNRQLFAHYKKQLSVAYTAKNVSCYGLNDGQISLTIKGGKAPYQINWSNGSNATELAGLAEGLYNVTVTDANGNTAQQSVSIIQPYRLTIHGNSIDESCVGKNGAVQIRVTGGTYPANYYWSNGSTSQNLESVSAGDYSVNVADANGCRSNATFNVIRKRSLTVDFAAYKPLCTNDESGLIDITVKNGEEPFTYKWNNGATSEDISGLNAGNYSVMVTDKNNCTAILETKLDNPLPIIIEPVVADATPNKNNGSIALNVSGGAGGYKFLWSTMDETNWLKNIEEGVYAVKVTDKNGCFESDFYTVHQVEPMQVTANVYNLLCQNDNTGMIDLTIEGGKKPYNIKWSNGSVFEDLAGIEAGKYTVHVTDANEKTITKTFTVLQPEALTVFATVTDETLTGNADGKINLEITGGSSPYLFDWTSRHNQQNYYGLTPGIYSVTITDAHKCVINHEILVSTQIIEAASASVENTYQHMLRLSETENIKPDDISIFPNPFNSSFTIRMSNNVTSVESIQVFSLEGKLIKSINHENLKTNGNSVLVNCINLSNGNYFIKINSAEESWSKIITRQN